MLVQDHIENYRTNLVHKTVLSNVKLPPVFFLFLQLSLTPGKCYNTERRYCMKKFWGRKIQVLCIHFAPVYLKQNKTKKEKNLIVTVFFFFCYKEAIVYMLWLVMKKWGKSKFKLNVDDCFCGLIESSSFISPLGEWIC